MVDKHWRDAVKKQHTFWGEATAFIRYIKIAFFLKVSDGLLEHLLKAGIIFYVKLSDMNPPGLS